MKKKLMLVALSVIMAFSIVFGLNACSKDNVVKYVYTNYQGEVSCFEIDFNAETYKYEGNGFYSESLEYMLRPGTSYSVESTIYYVKTVNNQKVYNFHDHPWNYEYTFSISEDGNTLYAINGYIKFEFIKDGIGSSQNNNQTPDNENTEQGGNGNSNNDENIVFYEVNFNDEYNDSSILVEAGSKIKLEVLERSGYEFLGWEINGELKQGGEYITVNNDITCIAKWHEIGAFQINYILNGGEFYKFEGINPPQEISDGMLPYTLPSPYGDNGNCFVKWTTDEAGNNEITKLTELKEYTLYAQYEPAENHFTYKYNESLQGYEVVSFAGFAKSVEIPSSYKNVAVKGIGRNCFPSSNNRLLTSIEIPNSIISIGVLSDNEVVGCLTKVNYLGTIDSWVQLEFADDGYVSNPLIYARNLYINDVLVTEAVLTTATSIGDYAFCNCESLTSIVIPNSVTSIGEWAFDSCSSLTSIEIPNSVTSIYSRAFCNCKSLTSVTFGENSQLTSIGNGAFYNCSSLTSIEIPNSVTSIGSYAFSNCTSLTSIEIPDSVTSIGNGAFYYCESLTSIVIPDSVTSIGDYAFDGCSNLKTMVINSNYVVNASEVVDIVQECVDVYIQADISITSSIYNVLFNNLGIEEIDGVEYYHYQIKE